MEKCVIQFYLFLSSKDLVKIKMSVCNKKNFKFISRLPSSLFRLCNLSTPTRSQRRHQAEQVLCTPVEKILHDDQNQLDKLFDGLKSIKYH